MLFRMYCFPCYGAAWLIFFRSRRSIIRGFPTCMCAIIGVFVPCILLFFLWIFLPNRFRHKNRIAEFYNRARDRPSISKICEDFRLRVIVPIRRILPASLMCREVFILCQELYIIGISLILRIFSSAFHMLPFKCSALIIVGFALIRIEYVRLLLFRPVPGSFPFLN